MKQHTFMAIDLGATSGRTVIGRVGDDNVELEELTRFPNYLVNACGHVFWNLTYLYQQVIEALQKVAHEGISIESIGIDTWGCDFTIFADDGQMVGEPIAYRDPFTTGAMERFFRDRMPKEKLYDLTGIQFMNFNSVFKLFAMQRENNASLRLADKILFTPDALAFMLTGQAVCEYTIASTSQLLNPRKGDLDEDILQSLGLHRNQFGRMVQPGTVVGTLTPQVQKLTGLGAVPVIAVAEHDTASAVAATPARREGFAYLSSGTWSLMGIESKKAIISPESFNENFTNEGGIDGTTRFLKNICGMWLYERCRAEWPELKDRSHKDLQDAAAKEEPFRSIIFPDDPLFANPDSMTTAINTYCRRTSQPIPETPTQYCRCIFDSLALRYREIFALLQRFSDVPLDTLHIIGGGSKNRLLNQMTASACGVTVVAGPQECTALGNVLLQARAAGEVSDIWEARRMVAASNELERFEPEDAAIWAKACEKYREVVGA